MILVVPQAIDLFGWAALLTAVGTLQISQLVASIIGRFRRRGDREKKAQAEQELHATVGQIKEQVANSHKTNLRDDLDRQMLLVSDLARSIEALILESREMREDLRMVRRDQTAERENIHALDVENRKEHAVLRQDLRDMEEQQTGEHDAIRAEILETARKHHPDAA